MALPLPVRFEEAVREVGGRFAGCCFTSGSAGTTGAGDYLKVFPGSPVAVGEALNVLPCSLTAEDHRIEGIGDKHVPWVHNVKIPIWLLPLMMQTA